MPAVTDGTSPRGAVAKMSSSPASEIGNSASSSIASPLPRSASSTTSPGLKAPASTASRRQARSAESSRPSATMNRSPDVSSRRCALRGRVIPSSRRNVLSTMSRKLQPSLESASAVLSSLASRSISSNPASSRAASTPIAPAKARYEFGAEPNSCCWMISAKPWIAFTGVRSSCSTWRMRSPAPGG